MGLSHGCPLPLGALNRRRLYWLHCKEDGQDVRHYPGRSDVELCQHSMGSRL